jgi:hypothetical protein
MEKGDGHIIGISKFEVRNPNVMKQYQMSKLKAQMKSKAQIEKVCFMIFLSNVKIF